MTTPDLKPLRDKARAKMTDGKLPNTLEAVGRIVADVNDHQSGVCGICDAAISKAEFSYLVYQSGMTPTKIPMHFLCHAAWQLEVRGMLPS
jgi:hypothetical protein